MTPKEKADLEAKKLNEYKNKRQQTCYLCRGCGNRQSPVFGDPNLGYVNIGKCNNCHGTGKENLS